MAEQWFNEAQRFLLENWGDALLLEESMNAARAEYSELFGKVLDSVRGKHPELDCRGIHILPSQEELHVGIGKSIWPHSNRTWPSGLWLGSVRLENLASSERGSPYACVWLDMPKSIDFDQKQAEETLHTEALRILPKEHRTRMTVVSCQSLWYPLPEPREELFKLLLEDGACGFIERMVTHFETLTAFIPVIDEIFQDAMRSRK